MSTNLKEFVTDIANAIRSKKGTTELINPQDFAGEIKSIRQSGTVTTNEKVVEIVQRSITNITAEELDGLNYVGNRAFMWCQYLEYIGLPDTVVSIGDRAFQYCKKLKNITVPDGAYIGHLAFSECESLETAYIKGASYLGEYVFANCTALQRLEFPDIEFIPQYSCYRCSSLESVTIPETVERINKYAFYGCRKLKDLTIPASVKVIEGAALQIGVLSVGMFAKIRLLSQVPPSIEDNSIGKGVGRIIVPTGTRDSYISATNWANYADFIKEE